MSNSRQRFRASLGLGRCLHPASVFDAPTALIAEGLGYESGILGGSVASLTVLGAPDLILLTLSEFVEQARRICRASGLPLMVDADHGYGNALNVMRSVVELEAAGVVGLTIEDTVLPRPFGAGGMALVSIEEAVGKLRAAVAARVDPELVVVGRTGALEVEGLAAAIARARAYEAAGVDAVFFTGMKTKADLEAISAAISVPVFLGQVGAEIADDAYLASQRVRFQILGHQTYQAALEASYQTLKSLREGVKAAALVGLAPKDRLAEAERRAVFSAAIGDFMAG